MTILCLSTCVTEERGMGFHFSWHAFTNIYMEYYQYLYGIIGIPTFKFIWKHKSGKEWNVDIIKACLGPQEHGVTKSAAWALWRVAFQMRFSAQDGSRLELSAPPWPAWLLPLSPILRHFTLPVCCTVSLRARLRTSLLWKSIDVLRVCVFARYFWNHIWSSITLQLLAVVNRHI